MASIRPHRPLVLLLIAVASLAVILGVAAIPAPAPAPPAGLLGALPAPAQAPSSLRAPATRDRFYFLLPDRFDNADPSNDRGGLTGSREVTGFDPTGSAWFHGGDLKGTIAKLDYIRGLGTSALWLTPVFKNMPVQGLGTPYPGAGYHGYWITDFLHVDPHLGTDADLRELISQAHARGMKVYFDIVVNHTADVISPQQKSGGPAPAGYVAKKDVPYVDAAGAAFDDRDYLIGDQFPILDANRSFPYRPVATAGQQNLKNPAWLNDVTVYHNRGNTTYSGESETYGDFAGLDDLFTEQPRVVTGMEQIFDFWIQNYGIDGFRIDTMKYVNLEFWQQFLPHILATAKAAGKPDFFAFGEVYDLLSDPYLSRYTTAGKSQAVLDFTFQQQARNFGASQPTDQLRTLFADDDWFTDADSNAYQLPTFLGNHDMGHIGAFLRDDNPGVSKAELLKRDELVHALMFTSRGNPVVYYGDEQGFTGAPGGDKAGRQDMFASKDADYSNTGSDAGLNDDIGSDKTPADDDFDPNHPLYRTIATLSRLREQNPALADGIQQVRSSSSKAGIFAFSRLDPGAGIEYVVVFDNAVGEASATVPTYSAGMEFDKIWGTDSAPASLTSASDTTLGVRLPGLSAAVYRARAAVAPVTAAPSVSISAPAELSGRPEISATVGDDSPSEVSFYADAGQGWRLLGTDDSAPYRVFPDVSGWPAGTALRLAAVVRDDAGSGAEAQTTATVVAAPPAASTTAIVHYRRSDGAYADWGLHVWGDGLADGVATDWSAPRTPSGRDDFGEVFQVPLTDPTPSLSFIIHRPNGSAVPASQEPGGNQAFVPAEHREVWIVSGDPTLHTSRP